MTESGSRAERESPRPGRYRLRRRILWIVLALGFIPSFITLVVATFSARRVVQGYAQEQAQEDVFLFADRLGRLFQEEVESVADFAQSQPVTNLVASRVYGSGIGPSLLDAAPLADEERAFYLFVDDELFGAVTLPPLSPYDADDPFPGTYFRPGFSSPDVPYFLHLEQDAEVPAGVESVLRTGFAAVRENGEGAVFAFDHSTGTVEEGAILFWSAAPVRAGHPEPRDVWLVSSRPLVSVAAPVLEYRQASPRRSMVVSQRSGIAGAGEFRREVEEILQRAPHVLEGSAGLISVPGNPDVVYAYGRAVGLGSLTRGTDRDAGVFVFHRVDLGTATNALYHGFWTISLYGIIFVILMAGLGVWLSRRLVLPITVLRAGFSRLERGDLDYRVSIDTGDEIEELAVSMNSMARTLQTSYRTLADKLLQLDEKARQLGLMLELARSINRSLDLPTLLKDIVRDVRRAVTAEWVTIGLLAESPRCLEFPGHDRRRGWRSAGDPRLDFEGTLTERAFAEGRVLAVSGNIEGEYPEGRLLEGTGARSLCVVPLRTNTGPVGALILADALEDTFKPADIEILESLAATLANAVEHGRLYAQQASFASELERQVLERTKELQEAQHQLVQAEKFAATGEVAANVAHEVNNPLSIIKNHLKLVQGALLRPQTLEEGVEPLREGLAIIEEEIDRIARIVDQLRKLNTPFSATLTNVSVNAEVMLVLGLFRQTFHQKKIHVDHRFDPSLDRVLLCADFFRQILINLLRNAYDAVKEGGQIVVETVAHSSDKNTFALRVRDDGPGIPQETLARIFDPFFTTKKEGKGTGLGLSVSYGLARQMGGRIEAASPPGGGAVFTVLLPMVPPEQSDSPAEPEPVRNQGSRIIIG